MCGIAGYFGRRIISPASVERMMTALRQRGPDAEHMRFWDDTLQPTTTAAPNALLHTRLSIIDPRPLADQPMDNATGDVWIAYNGEVYDWAADAETLRAAGYAFRTRSDTEFILHAYEHWGIDFVSRLRGMFAFAILDLRQRALYLVRDRLGLKPIVYAHRDDGFAFASTTRALLPWLPREARAFAADGIDAYLAHRTIPAPRTIFASIARLPPAHWLRYDLDDRPRGNARILAARARRRAVACDVRRGDPDAHRRRPAAGALPVVGCRFLRDRLPARGDGLQPAAKLHGRLPGHDI